MSTLAEAVEALKVGDRAQARSHLAGILKSEPQNVQAWLYMAKAVDTDEQRRSCLERILKIDPEHAVAKRGMEILDARRPRNVTAGESPISSQSESRHRPVTPVAPPAVSGPQPAAAVPAPKARKTNRLIPLILALTLIGIIAIVAVLWHYAGPWLTRPDTYALDVTTLMSIDLLTREEIDRLAFEISNDLAEAQQQALAYQPDKIAYYEYWLNAQLTQFSGSVKVRPIQRSEEDPERILDMGKASLIFIYYDDPVYELPEEERTQFIRVTLRPTTEGKDRWEVADFQRVTPQTTEELDALRGTCVINCGVLGAQSDQETCATSLAMFSLLEDDVDIPIRQDICPWILAH